MALFNHATKEVTAKLVYYGPGLCGKTTNLQWIHEKLNFRSKGRLVSLATQTDRTLFFDFLPLELGTIRGMRTRVQIYTVPGQVFYEATRRMVLKGCDAVVFVADSQAAMLDANFESLQSLRRNLLANEIDPTVPMVLQYNKRDLPTALPVPVLNARLNQRRLPFYEAVAIHGTGVEETLKGAAKLLFKSLSEYYGGGEANTTPAAGAEPATAAAPIPPRTNAPAASPPGARETRPPEPETARPTPTSAPSHSSPPAPAAPAPSPSEAPPPPATIRPTPTRAPAPTRLPMTPPGSAAPAGTTAPPAPPGVEAMSPPAAASRSAAVGTPPIEPAPEAPPERPKTPAAVPPATVVPPPADARPSEPTTPSPAVEAKRTPGERAPEERSAARPAPVRPPTSALPSLNPAPPPSTSSNAESSATPTAPQAAAAAPTAPTAPPRRAGPRPDEEVPRTPAVFHEPLSDAPGEPAPRGDGLRSDQWLYLLAGVQRGPIDVEALVDLVLTSIPEDTKVWHPGLEGWVCAHLVHEIAEEIPPPLPVPGATRAGYLDEDMPDFNTVPPQFRTALIADEDEAFRKYLAMPLAAQGFTVHEAADGSAAWLLAVQNRPWLILADVSMPEVDGFEFCRRVRSHPLLSHTPLLFISGSDKYKERYRALQIGADDFLSKQMPIRELLMRIQLLLTKYSDLGEPKETGVEEAAGAFQGRIEVFGAPALLQMCAQGGLSGILTALAEDEANTTAVMGFRDGEIISASTGTVSGPEAVYAYLAWERGSFKFTPGYPGRGEPLAQSVEHLLLEGCRLLDEAQQGSDDASA